MSVIEFEVYGRPATAGSKTVFFNKKTGKPIVVPASKFTKPWMDSIRAAAREFYSGELLRCALRLTVEYHYVRPDSDFGTGRNKGILKKSAKKYRTQEPDLSKLVRAAEDAITGIIWKNDSQIVEEHLYKGFGSKPKAKIKIETLE